ncbi:MAG: beta-carotene 15,15'-dioxygenase, Brp/Blh family [Gammaproteobacteria bacterium]|jgi:Brp/Blh family beta-carotene 15,15'-monooxygenase|nr:beta-carotene 15,15'-dioxygenase, Brp/Blh family [Gammaproteobacteria bacterium]
MASSPSEARVTRWHRVAWLGLVVILILAWPALQALPPAWALWILAILVALFGLPHGALDPLVARAAGRWRTTPELLAHLAGYVALVAGVVMIWLIWPTPTLAAFLLLSAWHFGDDWRILPDGRAVRGWARGLAGLAVVGAPLFFHPDRVAQLFAVLVGQSGDPDSVALLVDAGQWLAVPGLIYLAALAVIYLRTAPLCALEWAALLIAAWWLPPLAYFAAYFCFLHSPRHLLGVASDPRVALGWRGLAVTAGLTLLTVLLGVVAFVALGEAHPPDARLLQIVFIGLAALTVPHMLLVERYAHASRPG